MSRCSGCASPRRARTKTSSVPRTIRFSATPSPSRPATDRARGRGRACSANTTRTPRRGNGGAAPTTRRAGARDHRRSGRRARARCRRTTDPVAYVWTGRPWALSQANFALEGRGEKGKAAPEYSTSFKDFSDKLLCGRGGLQPAPANSHQADTDGQECAGHGDRPGGAVVPENQGRQYARSV